MSQHSYYESRINLLEAENKTLKNKSLLFSWIRLALFICFVAFIILFFTVVQSYLFIVFSCLFLIPFIVIAIKHNSLEDTILVLFYKIQINKDEILFLNHDYLQRKSGKEFEDINPYLSNDFDLFGKGSLFQYFNRCKTSIGQKMLAQKLCFPEKDTDLIVRKQSAIKELCNKNDYLQNFQSYCKLIFENKNEISILLEWINEPDEDFKKSRSIAILLGSLNILWLILSALGVLTCSSFILPISLSLLVIRFYKNLISRYYSKINNTVGIFAKYAKVLKLIEDEPFESEYLRSLQSNLKVHETKASDSLNSLFKILNAFEIQGNALISFLLNSFFLFDIHVCYRLHEWLKKQREEVEKWFSTIGEFEVLISFASFSFNNIEDVTYPTLTKEDEFQIDAVELGHPLLHQDIRVNNDFSVHGVPSIQIITGANMAGKSTFLRTLAVNLLIAMNGAPVIAKKLSFFPCDILSSIKVQDSLTNNESYFYAELLRLKDIIEHVKSNPKTLVILDEILRGTNTKDKLAGSIGILKKLMNLNAMVIIATHDLSIAELENIYPGIVINSCFEVELTDDQLFFDYKLKPGISRKLNASFLMQKMEIID